MLLFTPKISSILIMELPNYKYHHKLWINLSAIKFGKKVFKLTFNLISRNGLVVHMDTEILLNTNRRCYGCWQSDLIFFWKILIFQLFPGHVKTVTIRDGLHHCTDTEIAVAELLTIYVTVGDSFLTRVYNELALLAPNHCKTTFNY